MWYRWKDKLINLENLISISKSNLSTEIIFEEKEDIFEIYYSSKEERDAEFEKICKLLGLSETEHISRCC